MRIWSLHPRYLDSKGLVALWREALLAKHVLEGRTKGYRHHPQLWRFQQMPSPVNAINAYLAPVCAEADRRGYNFDFSKIARHRAVEMPVNDGQLWYEFEHLLAKLKQREPVLYRRWKNLDELEVHPQFYVLSGEVEQWEKR